MQSLSPGPVLPHFPDLAASVDSAQGSHSIDDATRLRAEMALWMARRVEERAELKGCSGSGSGAREGREIDGAVLVRILPTVMASTAPSMPGETTGNSSMAFHPAGSGGAPPPGDASASPTGNAVGESPSAGTDSDVVENGSRRSLLGLSVKLDKYDGTVFGNVFGQCTKFCYVLSVV